MPKRMGIAFTNWPAEDKLAWRRSLEPGDLLGINGIAASWRPKTQFQASSEYGRWLAFLIQTDPACLVLSAAQRATEQRVRQYAAVLLARIEASSAASAIGHLQLALRAIAPEASWTWMRQIQRRLSFRAVAREKRDRLVHAAVLIELGEKLIEESQQQGFVRDPIAFRDGVIIKFLASRPLRRSNLASLELGRHVADLGSRITIALAGSETKNGRPIEIQAPDSMVAVFRRYIYEVRPLIAGSSRHLALWASPKGGPLTADGIYRMVIRRTHLALGRSVNPHLFRDIVATSFALERPDLVSLTMDLLNQACFATTDKYYLQSRSVAAGRRYADVIRAMREGLSTHSAKDSSLDDPSTHEWLTSTST